MKLKRTLKVIMLSILIALTSFYAVSPTQSVVAEAATKKRTKMPTISKKSLKLVIGDTHKLKIKNITKKAKIKWVARNKKIATVSKKGVVTAKSAGKTFIRVDIKDKWFSGSLSCNVEVVTDFDENEAKKQIKFTPIESANASRDIYMVTSTYKYPTTVSIDYRVNNNDGLRIDSGTIDVSVFPYDTTYISIPSRKNEETTVTMEYKYKYADDLYTEDEWKELCNSLEIQYSIANKCQLDNGTYLYTSYAYLKNISNKQIQIKYPLTFCVYDYNGNIIDLAKIHYNGILYQNEMIDEEYTLQSNDSFDNESIQKIEFFM